MHDSAAMRHRYYPSTVYYAEAAYTIKARKIEAHNQTDTKQNITRRQAIARIVDRTALQHLRGHVTSSVT